MGRGLWDESAAAAAAVVGAGLEDVEERRAFDSSASPSVPALVTGDEAKSGVLSVVMASSSVLVLVWWLSLAIVMFFPLLSGKYTFTEIAKVLKPFQKKIQTRPA